MQLTFYVVPMRIPSHVLPMVWASISCLSPCLRLLFALNGKHRSRMLDLYSVSVEACARCRLRVLAHNWRMAHYRLKAFLWGPPWFPCPLLAGITSQNISVVHAITTRHLRLVNLSVAGGRQRCRIVWLVAALREVVQIESYPNRALLSAQPCELRAATLYSQGFGRSSLQRGCMCSK